MMIAPETFVERYKDSTYAELIAVRDELIEEIKDYEEDRKAGNCDVDLLPSPDTFYQMNLMYLAELLKLMESKYNENTHMVDFTSPEEEQLTFIRSVLWDEYSEEKAYATKLLNKLVAKGNAQAINIKGAMYAEGLGVNKDEKKAFGLYKKAADMGDSLAMSNVGYAYFLGHGTAVNKEKAYKYWSMAATLGEWDAYVALGDMYRTGEVVPVNEKKAFELYDKCYQECDHTESCDAYPACLTRLGECFLHGIGIMQEPDLARDLLKQALVIYKMQINHGSYYASRAITRVEIDLSDLEKLG